jgi:hypothetical protein
MDIYLTGKQRLWIVLVFAWVLLWLFVGEPWRYRFPNGGWEVFLIVGIAPVALALSVIWVRHGLGSDRKKRERVARELVQTVTCPRCPQVWERSPGQIDFKCSRCGTAFKYCPHCGSTYAVQVKLE